MTDLSYGEEFVCSTKEALAAYTISYAPQHSTWSDKTANALRDGDWRTGVATIPVSGEEQASIVFTYAQPVTASSLVWQFLSGASYNYYGYMFLEFFDEDLGEWRQVEDFEMANPTTAKEYIRADGNNGRHVMGYFPPVTASKWRLYRSSSSYLALSEFKLGCAPTMLMNLGDIQCSNPFCSVITQYVLPSLVYARVSSYFKGATVSITSDTIAMDGYIDVNYRGYESDSGPGTALPLVTVAPGDEQIVWNVGGSGAGYGGDGSFSCYFNPAHFVDSIHRKSGPAYGLATAPWDYGSGGGSSLNTNNTLGHNGGQGGGRIRLTAKDEVRFYGGVLTAQGKSGTSAPSGSGVVGRGGGGAGGSVQIHSATRVAGSATVTVNGGGTKSSIPGGGGGGGRIAVLAGSHIDSEVVLSAFGGSASTGACVGAPGTIYTVVGNHKVLRIEQSSGSAASPAYTPFPADSPSDLDELNVVGSYSFVRGPLDGSPIRTKSFHMNRHNKLWGETTLHLNAETLYSSGRIDAKRALTIEVVDAQFDTYHRSNASESVRIVGPGLVDDVSHLTTRKAMTGCPANIDPVLAMAEVTVTGTIQEASYSVSGRPKVTDIHQVLTDFQPASYFQTSATVGSYMQWSFPRPVTLGNFLWYQTSTHRSYTNGARIEYYDEASEEWVGVRDVNSSMVGYNLWESVRFEPHTAQLWRIKHQHVSSSKYIGFKEIHPRCDRATIEVRSGANLTCLAFDCRLEVSAPHAVVIEDGILAASTVTIDVAGLIADASITTQGRGYPAATGPGAGPPSIPGLTDTSVVSGTGGGHGGEGGHTYHTADVSNPMTRGGSAYGSASNPRHYGSGGGKGYHYDKDGNVVGEGGSGGGVVIVTARDFLAATTSYAIESDGHHTGTMTTCTGCGGGAGGSVLLRADRFYTHTDSSIVARGACGTSAGCGGGGRIAVYSQDELSYSFPYVTMSTISEPVVTGRYGGAGTIYTSFDGNTTLWIDARNYEGVVGTTPYPSDLTSTVHQILVRQKARLSVSDTSKLVTQHLAVDANAHVIGNSLVLNVFKVTNRGYITGEQSVTLTDARFRSIASSLTKAGACYGGGMNTRWKLTTSHTSPPADLEDRIRDPYTAGMLLPNPSGALGSWWQFEFPAAVLLSTVRLTFSDNGNYLNWRYIEISNDGVNFEPHYQFGTMTNARHHIVEFPPVAAKYWRIHDRHNRQVGLDYIDWGCAGPVARLDAGSKTVCTSKLCAITLDMQSQFAAWDITGFMYVCGICVAKWFGDLQTHSCVDRVLALQQRLHD